MKNIHLWGVKQNNLKNIEVKIPLGSFTVICGPSGSGKSSLAFETLFAEGQRRFIESMSNYARQFLNKAPKPDVEGVENIPPAISIEQKNSVKNSRSTVGTTTELIDYLRLLFEKIGVSHCPTHHIPTTKQSTTQAADLILQKFEGQRGYILIPIHRTHRIAEDKALLSLLLQDGFTRIFRPKSDPTSSEKSSKKKVAKKKVSKKSKKPSDASLDIVDPVFSIDHFELVELQDPSVMKQGLPEASFYLVMDRLAFSSEDRGRLVDSLSQAYQASMKFNSNLTHRQAKVVTTDNQLLHLSEENSCPLCQYTPPRLTTKLLSFNSPLGACPTCKGFGNILDVDEAKVVPNPNLSLSQGALNPFTMPSAEQDRKALFAYCKKAKIDLHTPWSNLPAAHKKLLWDGSDEFFGVKGLFQFLEQMKYKMHVRVFIARYRSPFQCPDCQGKRLRPEAQHVLLHGKNIPQLSDMTVEDLHQFFETTTFSKHEIQIANEALKQVRARLKFLIQVGVSYLSLNRETRTLSGGEYQRIMLSNQLGMGLSQTLYVLDEPTVGLHPRDNDRLISIMKDLKELGNTLVVVEHDHDVIQNADHVIEMGPGSGQMGGEIVFEGPTSHFLKSETSLTASYLRPSANWVPLRIVRPVNIEEYKFKITVKGARGHNLKNVDVQIPLHRLVAVSGVSGSGKSTLITHTLYPALARFTKQDFLPTQDHDGIEEANLISEVVMIDQSSIGKNARSNPMTYMKTFDLIRNLLASTPEAKQRKYTPGTFSLNVDGGRCPSCKGTGFEEIDMMFMDNVLIPCDVCDGKKYRDEILEIEYNKKNVSDILKMTVAEAMNFFVAHPQIRRHLSLLKEVGLDYLQLGQPASTLSGGESQRLKIARELNNANSRSTLYILDEPTTGLHFREIELLMKVLNKLIEAGGSVLVVEHNQDVLRGADYIIDMGPDAGDKGGQVVACGSPEQIMNNPSSLTGQHLRRYIDAMSPSTKNWNQL